MSLNSSLAWSRFIGWITLLAVMAGCSSAPQSPTIEISPTPAVSPSPQVSPNPPTVSSPHSFPPGSQPPPLINPPTEASRTVEKCVIRMARVNDPDSPLNVRSSPNATSKDNIVGTLRNGAYVEVKDEQDDWFNISGETPGWIAKSKTESNCGEKIERVQFGSGQSKTAIRDRFIGVGTHSYHFNLAKGQRLSVTVDRGGVFPRIIAPNGKDIVSSPEQSSPWIGDLTETGDYTFQLESNYKGYQYAFSVQVR